MATKRQAMKALDTIGARWDDWGGFATGGMRGTVWAAEGKIFKANNGHTLAVDADTRPEGWADILEDLTYGIEDCPGCPDCKK